MTHVPIQQVRIQVQYYDDRLHTLTEDMEALVDGMRHIDIDLSNTLDEFVATTGRAAEDFYRWRRKAKWARYYKERGLEAKKDEVFAVKQSLTNAQMQVLALEAGYVGEDAHLLLRAMYHLVMDVLGRSRVPLDPHQVGLIAAVRRATDDTLHEDVIQ